MTLTAFLYVLIFVDERAKGGGEVVSAAIIGHDLLAVGVSIWLALFLRFGHESASQDLSSLVQLEVLSILVAAVTFYVFGVYRALWRYASVCDLVVIIKASTVAVAIFWVVSSAVYGHAMLGDGGLPLIQWLSLIVMLGGPRLLIRALSRDGVARRSRSGRSEERGTPSLIAGATSDGAMFLRAMHEMPAPPCEVLGVLDDAGGNVGRSMHGVPMLGATCDLAEVVAKLSGCGRRPQQLIIALSADRVRAGREDDLAAEAKRLGLAVARVPSMADLGMAGNGAVAVKPITPDSLLNRAPVVLDHDTIEALVRNRRVLVTGAGGTIGSELSSQIASLLPADLILVEHNELSLYSVELELRERHPDVRCMPVLCNISDKRRVEQLFDEHHPELVFNAAALKHVPLVENNPCDGVLTNVVGTRNIADAAWRHQALAMIQISTDKAINPTSVMGASKLLAEQYCQALDVACSQTQPCHTRTRFVSVRFGNVLGSSGSVVPLFLRQLARGGPLTVTHPDMKRFFLTVREAVELVLQASAHGLLQPEQKGEIFVLDMGEPVRIVDIALRMIRLAGFRPEVDIKIEFTGLRPGERLDDELFHDGETPHLSAVPGVFAAMSPAKDLAALSCELDKLATLAHQHDKKRLRAMLSRIVPSYTADLAPVSKRLDPANAPPVAVKGPEPDLARATPTPARLTLHAPAPSQ